MFQPGLLQGKRILVPGGGRERTPAPTKAQNGKDQARRSA